MKDILKFCSLSSGSCGNANYIEYKDTKVLIDAGLNGVTTENALKDIGTDIKDLDAVILTHEHRDHVQGAGILSRKYGAKLYANEKTYLASLPRIGSVKESHVNIFDGAFEVKDLVIKPFKVYHDAYDPVGLAIYAGNKKLSILTDTGLVDGNIADTIKDSDIYYIESNHDEEMLEKGPYSYYLKRRVRSEEGHLSNMQAADLIKKSLKDKNELVFLAHLSHENNTEKLAYMTVYKELIQSGRRAEDFRLRVTHRLKRTLVYEVD